LNGLENRGSGFEEGRLPLHEAHVWWARRGDASAHLRPLLDETERARLDAYARADDQQRFIVGCATAKLAIGRYLNIPAARIEFARTCSSCGQPHGKPRLRVPADAQLELSISHAGDFVAVALTRQAPVGIDVERLDRSLPIGELAPTVLANTEICALSAISEKEQSRSFLIWWTRKEAVVKAIGEGFQMPPSEVVVSRPEEPPRLLAWPHHIPPDRIALFDLGEREDHVSSLATVGACTSVREFDGTALVAAFERRQS
jgi:4'-phosphopantetheinyl transferase